MVLRLPDSWSIIVLSFDHRVCFLRNILGKRSDLLFSRKSDRKKEKSVVSFTHEQNSICSQKQLNDIAHEQTIICRQLFAGHVVGSRPMKRKKHLHRMIKCVSQLRRFPPIPYPFNFARRRDEEQNFCKSFSRAVYAVVSRCI